jgi:hypothetical protein
MYVKENNNAEVNERNGRTTIHMTEKGQTHECCATFKREDKQNPCIKKRAEGEETIEVRHG